MTRIAVVGAGRWGKNIARTLFEMGALAAVCDADETARSAAAAAYAGVTLFSEFDRLLESDGFEAIVIASPVNTHYELARKALEAGIDVFVEKPITMFALQARELAEIARQRGAILMAGHLLLFQPAISFIKEFIDAGKLGEIRFMHQVRKNLGTVRTAENVILSLGVHDVAVALYLMGESPDTVSATGNCLTNPGIEDEAEVVFGFTSRGSFSRMSLSWLWPSKDRRLVVYGRDGFLEFDEGTQAVTHVPCRVARDGKVDLRPAEVVFRGEAAPLSLEMAHFIECVRSRETPRSGGDHAAECVGVIERIQESLRSQRKA